MTAWSALAVAYAGFVTLALAMERHQLKMLGRELPHQFTLPLRIVGGVLLGGALAAACMHAGSTSVGLLWWLGLLSVAGVCLGLLLAYQARWAWLLGAAVLPIASIAGLMRALG